MIKLNISLDGLNKNKKDFENNLNQITDEVRKLAEQSLQAVNNVKNTIQEVCEAFKNLSHNISEHLKFITEDMSE